MIGALRAPRLRAAYGYVVLLACLLASWTLGLLLGDVKMSLSELSQVLWLGPGAQIEEAFKHSVVWQIRLPRLVATTASGAILAASGVMFQSVLRNPLAEPYTLGVASGAAFGAACAIVAGLPWVTGAAFAGALLTIVVVWIISENNNKKDMSRIILAGVIVGSILSAGLTLLKALAGERVSAIVVWLMGSFSAANWLDAPPLVAALGGVYLLCQAYARELDIMASGVNGESLGVNLARDRLVLLGGASLAVSFVVSRYGVIGFVGLVVPHLLRLLFGPAHRHLLPLSILGGASLLTLADVAAKQWNELPAGVLTVLIGGPVFCLILWERGR